MRYRLIKLFVVAVIVLVATINRITIKANILVVTAYVLVDKLNMSFSKGCKLDMPRVKLKTHADKVAFSRIDG